MNLSYSEAGNKGERVRSDCWVGINLTSANGIKIELRSKVIAMYGNSIIDLVNDMMAFFEINNAEIEIEDSGAIPFVIMARVESAVRKLGLDKRKKYLEEIKHPVISSLRNRLRRSRLYLPGDQPKLFLNAAIHNADGLILDLEDSVHPSKKGDARILVRNALRSMDFMGSEKMVRINQIPLGYKDLEEVLPQEVDLILIPKVENPEQIQEIDKKVDEIFSSIDSEKTGDVFFMPIIESALGTINAYSIAKASKRNVALAIGLEDYTADIGTQRTNEGKESFFARSMLVNAAKAAEIQAIDTVFSDVSDMHGLRESSVEAKSLGFDGKGCIHPRQIAIVNKAFIPDEKEIEKAKKIVVAFEKAEKLGLGVVSLESKMIDPPVVKRALRTIEIVRKEGIITENWRDEYEKV